MDLCKFEKFFVVSQSCARSLSLRSMYEWMDGLM